MTFKGKTTKSAKGRDIKLVRGSPDCAAFYNWVRLQIATVTPNWPVSTKKLSPGKRGNIGEFIAYIVARNSGLSGLGYTVALAVALTPLAIGTAPGLDITILHLDPNGDETKDCLYIMEVKTTGRITLTYANALIEDYRKLLGTTSVSTSLAMRMNWLQAKLMFEHNMPDALLKRAGKLFMPDPKDCLRVKLMPTLVHDLSKDPTKLMLPVKTLDRVGKKIEDLGWRPDCISPWSIAITRLNGCMVHLSKNDPAFKP